MITLQEMAYLSTLYTQPHRHYHNMNHINECLAEFENIDWDKIPQVTMNQRSGIQHAIWYHDAVYNPMSKMNEYNSAQLVGSLTSNDGRDSFYEQVRSMIYATANHTVTQAISPLFTATMVMLDIDLAGFGQPFDICWKNSENIRKEFYFVNDLDFSKGRLTFLETIQKRESLYYTEYFYKKYHAQSQKNIALEIAKTKEIIDQLTV